MGAFDTERFISEIESRPSLWDPRSADYTDRELKRRCWDDIIDIFKDEEHLTTRERKNIGDALQKKWKSIRGCFTRELSRKRALKTGTDNGLRKTEYIYYNQLKFLKKVVTTKDTNTQAEEDDSTESAPRKHRREQTNVELDDASNSPRETKRLKREQPRVPIDDDPLQVNRSGEAKNAAEDEDRLFLLSLLSALKKVPEHKKMATKIRMMELLDDAAQPTHVKEEYSSDMAYREFPFN